MILKVTNNDPVRSRVPGLNSGEGQGDDGDKTKIWGGFVNKICI